MNVTCANTARLIVEPISGPDSVEEAVVRFASAPDAAILESSMAGGRWGRFSIFACDPADVLEMHPDEQSCPFETLGRRINAVPTLPSTNPHFPCPAGWFGFITYEAGLRTERITTDPRYDASIPLLRFCLYDTVAVYDHDAGQWYAATVDWPPRTLRRPAVGVRLAAIHRLLNGPSESSVPAFRPSGRLKPSLGYGEYLERVDRAKRHIESGDIYQVNLTVRMSAATEADPVALYLRLREASPSPYAALIKWGNTAILSSSPELFLQLREGHVITRPIKGTRPRVGDLIADQAYCADLRESDKDSAELNMIVDLLRNDLGRVCSYGSVRVVNPVEIEQHPTVFHRVATIEGRLHKDRTWVDLLRAAFPGGSVTGCPKIRAMQIINELEPNPRGVYCGSIGWIGLDGSMTMNIAIRTMVKVNNSIHLYAGGAIVADSDAKAEYEELQAKAVATIRAIGGRAPSIAARPREVPVP